MAPAAPLAPATPAAAFRMISIPEAQATVLEHTHPLPPQTLQLGDTLGRILTEDVTASEPLPPYPASIKDGYAVVSSDGPQEYEVAFEALAGSEQQALQPGTIAYIGTGGPVPHGADAVVQIEDTQVVGRTALGAPVVDIKKAARPGQDIRAVGSDIRAGETVLAAGERIGPAEIGLLATVGATAVQVHAAPHVAVLSTGDEVADPATPHLRPGAIRDANRPMLLAAAADAGASTMDLGIVPDTAGVEGLEAVLQDALDAGADVLITSGGVSMGDKDFVKPLLERHAKVHFGRVRMKPGKPLTFATLDRPDRKRMMVFGLPGNPVSSLVTFNLVVLPALRRLAGWKEPMLRRLHATLSAPLRLDPVRPEYHRAALRWAPPSPQRPLRPPLQAQHAAGSSVQLPAAALTDLLEVPLLGVPAAGWPTTSAAASQVEAVPASPTATNGGQAGGFAALSTGGQISSRLLSMRSAAALLELPQVPTPPLAEDLAEDFADENLLADPWQPARRPDHLLGSHPWPQQQFWQYDGSSSPQRHSSAGSPAKRLRLDAEVVPSQAPWLQPEQHFDALWQCLPTDADGATGVRGSSTSSTLVDSDNSSSSDGSVIRKGDASVVGRVFSALVLLGRGLAYLL